ncbi:MAG: hypothetical protein MJ162_03745 [Treponema sp.]|nr:hypothetical protein [Treponema sp.]
MLLFTKMVLKSKETTFAILFSLLLLVSGLIFSCSNSTSNITVYQEIDTLRNYVQNKEIGVLWTKELDESALTKNIRTSKDINSNASYSIDGVKAMKKSGKPIYPSLKGFTSLDITNLDAATIETVVKFYDAVSENREGKIHTFFDSNYIFNYVFFMNDLKTIWKDMTGSEYPAFYKEEDESAAA